MLSVIIPALDEAKYIGKTLSALQRQEGDFEIIVVDGGSEDATRKISEQLGVQVIKTARGITHQLEEGMKRAKGEAFLFLHADTMLPTGAIELIAQEVTQAGGFTVQYDKFDLLSAVQALLTNANAKVFNRFSGEQAFFLTKEALMAAGGLPDVRVFETERLCEQLRKANIPIQLFSPKAITSNRRYRNNGLRAFLRINSAHARQAWGASEYQLKKYFDKIR